MARVPNDFMEESLLTQRKILFDPSLKNLEEEVRPQKEPLAVQPHPPQHHDLWHAEHLLMDLSEYIDIEIGRMDRHEQNMDQQDRHMSKVEAQLASMSAQLNQCYSQTQQYWSYAIGQDEASHDYYEMMATHQVARSMPP